MLMRSNAAVVAFRLVSIALQMAYIKLYSHYLSVAELGVFFYIMTLSYSINALLLVPLDFYQQAKLIKYYTAKLPLRALLVLNAQGLSAAFFLAMTLGGAVWVTGHIDFLSLVIAYFIAVSTYLCNAFRGFLNNIGHKYLVVFMLVMEVMMRMGLFILLMMFSLSKVHALIISSAVALVIEIGCFFLFFRGKNL
ncbi:MAG: hypothetical protein H6R07_3418, partial [Proteobacteria bacterium]|nr:hypothetical protein [Pseudomonadota bacterium]